MDGTVRGGLSELAALREAIGQASQAPSVDDTQPWRWVLRPDRLELHADETRIHRRRDPARRDVILSCGACLVLAQISLQANGFDPDVTLLPPGGTADLLAAMRVVPTVVDEDARRWDAAVAQLGPCGPARSADLDDEVRGRLIAAAAREGAWLWPADVTAARIDADGSTRRADGRQQGGAACYLLLGTDGDTPRDHLRAGRALGRVLLEAAASGALAIPVSSATNGMYLDALTAPARRALGRSGYPQILLCVGGPGTAAPATSWSFPGAGRVGTARPQV